MIHSALRTQVGSFLGDPDDTRYTPTAKTTALNRAQEQFAMDTRALWADQSYTTANGDADYNLPSRFMYEEWVTYDGKPLIPISRYGIVRLFGSDWAEEEGEPTHFIIDPEEGVKELLLFPIPQEAKTVVMRYYPLPTELSADSDVPLNSSALMAQFHMGLAAYAAWLLLLNEETTPAIVAKRRELLQIYADAVTKATDSFKNTASQPLQIRGNAVWG